MTSYYRALVIVVVLSVLKVTSGTTDTCRSIPFCTECPYNDENKPVCTKCSLGFGLDEATGGSPYQGDGRPCKLCSTNEGCVLCEKLSRCTRCKFAGGHGPDLNGVGTCSACIENCRYCGKSGGGKCDRCNVGYVLNADKTECTKCSIENCRNCDYSASSNKCDQCDYGYFIGNSGSQCFECPLNCHRCENANSCLLCKDGYFPTALTGSCEACVDNCVKCGSASTCRACKRGFYKTDDDKCSPCGQNCADCDSNGKCRRCVKGDMPPSGKCDCSQNCANCEKSGPGKCDKCRDGYTLTNGNICSRRDRDNF